MNSKMGWWIIDQLIAQGVSHFCIAPGSRSTPLALAAAHHPKAQIHIHFDERGLAFYALGLSTPTQTPAAIIVTSGTAVGNLLPAIMEAHHSNTPLIILSADRPPELIDAGANQATDQLKIFQNFTRFELNLPPADTATEGYVRSSVAHAFCLSIKNPGPVQINWQIKEPLFTPPFPKLPCGSKIDLTLSKQIPSKPTRLHGNGVIAIGKLSRPSDLQPILDLAKKLRWPLFGDILSNARLSHPEELIVHYDWILKANPPKADTLLHFGERMTSKKYLDWAKAPRIIHVSPHSALQDPARVLTERVLSDPAPFCEMAEITPAPREWLAEWQELDSQMDEEIKNHFEGSNLCTEAHAFRALSEHLDSDGSLFLGNGMPIRDGDHFCFPSSLRSFYSNRGLSGIDGNIATAAGLSAALKGPVVAWIGDQATLHDLNSLSLLTTHQVILIISNNFGGGIFSHLPIAKATEHFESLFANAHNLTFEHAAKQFDLPYQLPIPTSPNEKTMRMSLILSLCAFALNAPAGFFNAKARETKETQREEVLDERLRGGFRD